jgi:hypothetical protein
MRDFDIRRIVHELHNASPESAKKIVADLSAEQADQVLLFYRDRFPGPDGNTGFWLLSDKVCSRQPA